MKVLLYDIETSPNLAYVWGKWQQDVIQYESEWYLLTVAWKWLDENKVHCRGLDDFKEYKKAPQNDIELARLLHGLFDEADVVVAHNGNSFDQKKAHARILYHGFTPPQPYRSVDTRLVARKYFAFNSNKLDDLGQTLGLGRKLQTGGFELWKKCMSGDPKAWKKMKLYNKRDVEQLEKIYLKMRPWMDGHPSYAVVDGKPGACPNCGELKMHKGSKYRATSSQLYQYYRCANCGRQARSRVAEPRLKSERIQYI